MVMVSDCGGWVVLWAAILGLGLWLGCLPRKPKTLLSEYETLTTLPSDIKEHDVIEECRFKVIDRYYECPGKGSLLMLDAEGRRVRIITTMPVDVGQCISLYNMGVLHIFEDGTVVIGWKQN
ncbi:TMhelix containing protein [Vibrio phage 1.244.A._10N.261.54.C3]|nr:TMhelix containing protein [Vibrio phage 1.244.A._10N.261.54.C3]AUR98705.1 TMhelix containing protein [Vibrio phage 1.255.O._10N.286.45.F1]